MIPTIHRRNLALGAGLLLAGLTAKPASCAPTGDAGPTGARELSHDAEQIHQTVFFKASPDRVYHVLTDATEFDHVVRLSGALQEMPPGALASHPTRISAEPGGAFSLFANYITGRHVEMLPATRLVQVWRSASWPPGCYSIVRFDLSPQSAGTAVDFRHTGFPAGTGPHLVGGWHEHYWEPLTKYLA